MNASQTTLSLLDRIQEKTLHIIGVNEEEAQSKLNIPPFHHRWQVAAVVVLYTRMQTKLCPAYLKTVLPRPYCAIRATHACVCQVMPRKNPNLELTHQEEALSIAQLKFGTAGRTTLLASSMTLEYNLLRAECITFYSNVN